MADTIKKITLILGSHAHVPYGSPDSDFENVYKKTLKPFISNLNKYPHIQAVLHYSGVLLQWIEKSHLELFMLIEDMVSRKQIELLGGGFYEPMLPLLSLQDKMGQIEMFTTYLRKQFGKKPQGCWVPALAWEQNLVGPLSACGMGYTFLGEDQFIKAGCQPFELFHPRLTEDQGKIITVFPLFRSVEKELAQKNVQAVFKKIHDRLPVDTGCIVSIFPESVLTAADEAEGYAWNRFFEELTLSESIVDCISPSKVYKGLGILNKSCFPDSVGGQEHLPRSFITAYPEAGGIYSKMIYTNLLINQLRGDKARKLNAREELWKAQGHGLFSSADALYRHCLRKSAYRSLVSAERVTREKTKFIPSLLHFDFDFNGISEFLFHEQKINCYKQSLGAGVFELDYLPRAWNYLDTCNYYNETPRTVQPPQRHGPQQHTLFRRTAFVDNFYPPDTDYQLLIDDAAYGKHSCAHEYYSVTESEKQKGKVVFSLLPAGNRDSAFGNMDIKKTYSLKKDTLTVGYALHNRGTNALSFLFAPDIELSFPCVEHDCILIFRCNAGARDIAITSPVIPDADHIKIHDIKNEVQITLCSSSLFDMCIRHRYIPLNGVEEYQSSVFTPVFPLKLNEAQTWTVELSLKFSN